MILALAFVGLLTPNIQAPWGVSMGESKTALIDAFKPVGKIGKANWTREKRGELEVFSFGCPSSSGCFSAPSAAQFHFVGDSLASATFTFRQEQSPDGTNINLLVQTTLAAGGFTRVLATQSAVGRRTKYLHHRGQTLVWVQDGPDIDLKLYRDEKAPIGRAEAVAAGAQLTLDDYPGAVEYSMGHKAIVGRRFQDAEQLLSAALRVPAVSPILMREARYVLAMVIAADVKTAIGQGGIRSNEERERADRRLQRAEGLAPSLSTHLKSLREQLKR